MGKTWVKHQNCMVELAILNVVEVIYLIYKKNHRMD